MNPSDKDLSYHWRVMTGHCTVTCGEGMCSTYTNITTVISCRVGCYCIAVKNTKEMCRQCDVIILISPASVGHCLFADVAAYGVIPNAR